MNHEKAAKQIARRPAVHRLCYGAFLQAPVWISPKVMAVPLAPLGFEAPARLDKALEFIANEGVFWTWT